MSAAKKATKPIPAGPQYCATISATMLGHFLTRLEVESRPTGGSLTLDQINEAATRFIADLGRFDGVLQRSWDDCSRAREAVAWDKSRRRLFDRVLMKRFAHLFPARSGDDGSNAEAVLSRRVIPGFNLAIDKMIGPLLHEQCQHRADNIVDRLRGKGAAIDWTQIQYDREARALVNDVLVVVAHYFGNFERRREWFMTLVNSNLAPAAADDPDPHWQVTPTVFQRLMMALFDDLFALMRHDHGSAIRARYGEHALETLMDFHNKLMGLRSGHPTGG